MNGEKPQESDPWGGIALHVRAPAEVRAGDAIVAWTAEAIAGARGRGFGGIELDLCPAAVGSVADSTRLEQAVALLRAQAFGVGVSAVRIAFGGGQDSVNRVRGLLTALMDSRARCINVWVQGFSERSNELDFQKSLHQAYGLLQDVRFDAESAGVRVCIDAGQGFLRSPVEARELIDSASSHAVGVCVDRTDSTVGSGGGSLEHWLSILDWRVGAIRLAMPDLRPAGVPERLRALAARPDFAPLLIVTTGG